MNKNGVGRVCFLVIRLLLVLCLLSAGASQEGLSAEAEEAVIRESAAIPGIPVLSQVYPGIHAKLLSRSGSWYARFGPGPDYAEGAGEYKAGTQYPNYLTVYFCENNWVLADIVCTDRMETMAWLPRSAVTLSGDPAQVSALDQAMGSTMILFSSSHESYVALPEEGGSAGSAGRDIPEVSGLKAVPGVTTKKTVPVLGPDERFSRERTCTIEKDTALSILFQENGYVYAEFTCEKGPVRMWLSLKNVSVKEN